MFVIYFKGKTKMETQRVNGWNYIDSVRNQTRECIKLAEQYEASENRAEAVKKYQEAADLISQMVTDTNGKRINLLQGMIVSANMLRIDRVKYLKKAEK
jgi:hypothetical protein